MNWSVKGSLIVPFDFSEHARMALRRAREIAEASQNIHVIHVLPLLVAAEPAFVWNDVDDAGRIQHALDAMVAELPEAEFGKLCLEARLGDPGSAIAQRAHELHAELIVVGSHGRSGLSRVLLGSTAERITRLAPCPVLIVKLSEESAESAANMGQGFGA